MSASRFFNAIPNAKAQPIASLIGYFVYYLTVEQGAAEVTPAQVGQCFIDCDLTVPGRLRSYLSEGVSAKPQRYVKTAGGYRLQRHFSQQMSDKLGASRVVAQTSVDLRSLESLFTDGDTRVFLREVIDCFEAGANRAAVIMVWVLTLDHFLNYVFANKLAEFNTALAANPDKKVKVVTVIEDFEDLREAKIIELCRSAGIITNGVRKILDDALGTRNSAAHPSSVKVARSKAISVIEDLVTNVIKKF